MATLSAEFTQQNLALAFDAYHQLTRDHRKNIVFSPLGIRMAFSMLYAGASGETEAELAQALHFETQSTQHASNQAFDDMIHPKKRFLQRFLGKGSIRDSESEQPPFRFSMANGVWLRDDLPVEGRFAKILDDRYRARVERSDFSDAHAISSDIQRWVEEETNGLISGFRPSITPETVLMLLNVLYFKDRWVNTFSEYGTQTKLFNGLNGETFEVDRMHSEFDMDYWRVEGQYQAVKLPYQSGDGDLPLSLSMLVIVPDEGEFERQESRLSPSFVQLIRESMSPKTVDLGLPKFSHESDLDLIPLLKDLGVKTLFDEGRCDLSRLSTHPGLVVSSANQKAKIAVDENGTEAAAVTSIGIALSAMPEEKEVIQLYIDRPFVYAIQEERTGVILFLGRVTTPST